MEDDVGGSGLDYGINAWHIRLLCENPWEGGGGYTPQQVADMTPDQIYFRLCKLEMFEDNRTKKVSVDTGQAATVMDDDGMIKGKLADGTVVKRPMRVDGKSLAQRMAEEAAKKVEEEKKKEGKRRKRKK